MCGVKKDIEFTVVGLTVINVKMSGVTTIHMRRSRIGGP